MNKPRVVFLHGLQQRLVDMILSCSPDGFTTIAVDGKSPQQQQVESVREADFIMMYRAKLTRDVLCAASKVRLLQLLAAGYESVNLNLLRELGIPCANNGGANSWAVADQAVLMMLSLYRRMLATDRDVRAGRWNSGIDGMNTFEMANKVVGILGFGNIGQKVARRLQGFDAPVQYYDMIRPPSEREQELGARFVSLDELFRTSDILTLHAPLTPDTRHVVNQERLAKMKRSAILINTSRGALVDEAALVRALSAKQIAGAGIDAFDPEPVEPGNPLLALDNVVLSPHCAGTTADTWVRRGNFAYQNFARVWSGQPALAIVREDES